MQKVGGGDQDRGSPGEQALMEGLEERSGYTLPQDSAVIGNDEGSFDPAHENCEFCAGIWRVQMDQIGVRLTNFANHAGAEPYGTDGGPWLSPNHRNATHDIVPPSRYAVRNQYRNVDGMAERFAQSPNDGLDSTLVRPIVFADLEHSKLTSPHPKHSLGEPPGKWW